MLLILCNCSLSCTAHSDLCLMRFTNVFYYYYYLLLISTGRGTQLAMCPNAQPKKRNKMIV